MAVGIQFLFFASAFRISTDGTFDPLDTLWMVLFRAVEQAKLNFNSKYTLRHRDLTSPREEATLVKEKKDRQTSKKILAKNKQCLLVKTYALGGDHLLSVNQQSTYRAQSMTTCTGVR